MTGKPCFAHRVSSSFPYAASVPTSWFPCGAALIRQESGGSASCLKATCAWGRRDDILLKRASARPLYAQSFRRAAVLCGVCALDSPWKERSVREHLDRSESFLDRGRTLQRRHSERQEGG